jgi:hypothetical protein
MNAAFPKALKFANAHCGTGFTGPKLAKSRWQAEAFPTKACGIKPLRMCGIMKRRIFPGFSCQAKFCDSVFDRFAR